MDYLDDWDWLFPKRVNSGYASYGKQGEHHVSKHVFHCTYCGCCWQREQDAVPTVYGQSKYEDFPAYGLKKKKCLECKAKEAEDAISDAKK
jgi:hypothetical protein